MSAALIWSEFIALIITVGIAGHFLSVNADKISERTRLGRNWIGVVLLATVTSLPEMAIGISSVITTKKPDYALGDVLGSCVFNLTLIFVLDLLLRKKNAYARSSDGHVLLSGVGMVLIGYVGFAMMVGEAYLPMRIGSMSFYSLLIPLIYLFAMRSIYRFEREVIVDEDVTESRDTHSKKIYLYFTVAAAFVIGAGLLLPFIGERVVALMGWNEAFVGTIFMALASSLPELAVVIGAVRIGAPELALSNLLGSNLFNFVVITFDDAFFSEGALLAYASRTHLVSVFTALMMTGLITISLVLRPKARLGASTTSWLIFFLFCLNTFFVYGMR